MGLFLGIDTSNYTTSVSICDENRVILNEKKLLDVKDGECGLRQSDAVFHHINNIIDICIKIGRQNITAIGCSTKPRDVEGSYMPCFKVGEAIAAFTGQILGVPVYKFSHQAGHICAAAYSADRMELLDRSFNVFHVSGGTTEILLCENDRSNLKITKLGGTLDLNAGQAIDRAGVLMGLKFPCGRELEQLASKGKNIENTKVCVNGLTCNLSGLENKVKKFYMQGYSQNDIANYSLSFIEKTLYKLTENLRNEYDLPILYAGGVMSNLQIQRALSEFDDTYFADKAFSSDNASGIALLAGIEYRKSL